jgi:hypothetical protein
VKVDEALVVLRLLFREIKEIYSTRSFVANAHYTGSNSKFNLSTEIDELLHN